MTPEARQQPAVAPVVDHHVGDSELRSRSFELPAPNVPEGGASGDGGVTDLTGVARRVGNDPDRCTPGGQLREDPGAAEDLVVGMGEQAEHSGRAVESFDLRQHGPIVSAARLSGASERDSSPRELEIPIPIEAHGRAEGPACVVESCRQPSSVGLRRGGELEPVHPGRNDPKARQSG